MRRGSAATEGVAADDAERRGWQRSRGLSPRKTLNSRKGQIRPTRHFLRVLSRV